MLAEPERTRYDLNFRAFGFPVRIHPFFWIGTALFGSSALDRPNGVAYLLAWVAIVFVSILIHELGHAFAFRLFGSDSHVVLHAFGGLAIPWSAVRGRWKRIIVALAGPFAGFLLFGILVGSNFFYHWVTDESPLLMQWVVFQLIYVNLWWGLINLLPVWPLDGGQVCEEVCSMFSPRSGRRLALQISITVAGVFCVYSLACLMGARQGADWLAALPWWLPRGSLWTAFLFGLLAVQSYQVLDRLKWHENNWER